MKFSTFSSVHFRKYTPFSLQGVGDMKLAYQCLRLALGADNDHAEAYNNLGVLELRKGSMEEVASYSNVCMYICICYV